MILIFEISLLDTWKKEEENAHKLSIAELAKRGSQIEERLRGELANIENTLTKGASSRNTSEVLLTVPSTEITKIYALSAMTYLHVVISGAHPELPEIIESVSKTIAGFQSLIDAKLLCNLVWPFCITGCLAREEQHAFFRDLSSAAEITGPTVGTSLEAFQIMEECWKARKTYSFSCDWVSIMNTRGHRVLLR
jgi:hypothetical protein